MTVNELIANLFLLPRESEVITNDGQPVTKSEIVLEDIFLSDDYAHQGTAKQLEDLGIKSYIKVVEKGTIVLC